MEPFEALTGDEAGDLLAIGLTNALVADLMPFDGLQVFAGPLSGDLPPSLANVPVYIVTRWRRADLQTGSTPPPS